jgi:hypothetical protein
MIAEVVLHPKISTKTAIIQCHVIDIYRLVDVLEHTGPSDPRLVIIYVT